jgi:EAL domain-containing protein (putative c-di-GMP-specific phosphodiesterase class I)
MAAPCPLPAHNIKIDKSFVMGLQENSNNAAIVKAIIDLRHNLGHTILAEGVEYQSVMDLLAWLQCDFVQGYYLSKALPVPELDAWMCNRGL